MDRNLYHYRKIIELSKNNDAAAFDHAWLFVKCLIVEAFFDGENPKYPPENMNVNLVDRIQNEEIRSICHSIRKKRNNYQHGTPNGICSFSAWDYSELYENIEKVKKYMNLCLKPSKQIKYRWDSVCTHITSIQSIASDNPLTDKKNRIQFESEYIYDFPENKAEKIWFETSKGNVKKDLIYPIGYFDSERYFKTKCTIPTKVENQLYAVIFNLLIRNESIPVSAYLKEKTADMSQECLECIFAYELLLLLCSCNKKLIATTEYIVPYMHQEYAVLACEDIAYYGNILSKMSGVRFTPISVRCESENKHCPNEELSIESDDIIISIIDFEGTTHRGIIASDIQKLSYSPVLISTRIEYRINSRNLMYYELLLHEIFGFDSFRAGQVETLYSITNYKDNHLIILPTGYGKSLIYQFLSLIQPLISVIISPTQILIYDQLENLKEAGINRAFHEDGKYLWYKRKTKSIVFASTLFYATPNEIQGEDWFFLLMDAQKENILNFIAIDECHQMSIWGHSFQADYFTLIQQISSDIPDAHYLLFSATASLRVKEDLKAQFDQSNLRIVQPCPLERSHIKYTTIETNSVEDITTDLRLRFEQAYEKGNSFDISDFNHVPSMAIIVCNNRQIQKMILEKLHESEIIGEFVACFHGEISVYNRFRLANRRIIITDDSILAGLNVLFLRAIIFIGIPPSKEWIYQETGRIGRAGEDSDVLIYTNKSKIAIEKLISAEYEQLGLAEEFYNDFSCGNLESLFSHITTDNDIAEARAIFDDINSCVYVFHGQKDGTVSGTMFAHQKLKYDKPLFALYKLGIITKWLIYAKQGRNNSSILTNNGGNDKILKYRYFINMEMKNGTVYFENLFNQQIKQMSSNNTILKKYIKSLGLAEDNFHLLISLFSNWLSENIFVNKQKMLTGTYSLVSNMPNLPNEQIESILCSYFGTDANHTESISSAKSFADAFSSVSDFTIRDTTFLDTVIQTSNKSNVQNISSKKMGETSSPKKSSFFQIVPSDDSVEQHATLCDRAFDSIDAGDISIHILSQDEASKKPDNMKLDTIKTTIINSCQQSENYNYSSIFPFIDFVTHEKNCDLIHLGASLERAFEYQDNINLEVILSIIEILQESQELRRFSLLINKLSAGDLNELLHSLKRITPCTSRKTVDKCLTMRGLSRFYYRGIGGHIRYLIHRYCQALDLLKKA